METVASATRLAWLVLAAGLAFARHAPAAGKPVALVGFTTDVRGVESGVMKPGRYVYEKFCDQWPDPDSYGNYSVIYFGEKLAGGAQGKNSATQKKGSRQIYSIMRSHTTVITVSHCFMRAIPEASLIYRSCSTH